MSLRSGMSGIWSPAPPAARSASQLAYRTASGSAVAPCMTTLSTTVMAITVTARPAVGSPSSSSASNANTTDARPRGPNQATKVTVAQPSRAPTSATATGTILTTVRLRTAYSTICQVTASIAGTSVTAPNASQTSKDTRAPISSTNGTNGSPRRPPVVPNASPPTNAAMNPLPSTATADA